MKHLIIAFFVLSLCSCKKKTQENIDNNIGTYKCIEISTNMKVDTNGNLYFGTDTTSMNTIIYIDKLSKDYLVTIDQFSFVSSNPYNKRFYSNCPNGPCSSVMFFSGDSIIVDRPLRVGGDRYYGKKQ